MVTVNSSVLTGSSSTIDKNPPDQIFIKDFGAVGDGVQDDSDFIQNAINYAVKVGKQLRITGGHYVISKALTCTQPIDIVSDSNAWFEANAGNNTDCFFFGNSGTVNWFTRLVLPNIKGFGGAAIHLLGVNLASIEFQEIESCGSGLLIETNAQMNSADNDITFNRIYSCTNGIHFKAGSPGENSQGTVVRGNFIDACTNSIYFDCPAGLASAPAWNLQVLKVGAVDGANVANSRGIYAPYGFITDSVFKFDDFFGGFVTAFVDCGSTTNNGNNIFHMNMNGNAPTPAQFKLQGGGHEIVNLYSAITPPFNQAAIAAVTASNNLAGFNGGKALTSTKTRIALPMPALAAGQSADFYIFHALSTFFSNNVSVSPRYNEPLVITAVEDEGAVAGIDGNTVANQIHIRVYAFGAVTAGNVEVTVDFKG